MLYPAIAICIASFAFGMVTMHKMDSIELQSMKTEFDRANIEASFQLQVAKSRVDEATKKAAELNTQIEAKHVEHTQTITDLRNQLSNIRLPDCSKNRRSTMPDSASTTSSISEARHNGVSTEFNQLVKDEFFRADKVAEYAEACYMFVSNNCGTQQ